MSTEAEERVARALATENGDDYDAMFASKSEWNAARGYAGGRFRTITEPMKSDYLDMARAAIAAVRAYDAETLSRVVLGKDGEVENG